MEERLYQDNCIEAVRSKVRAGAKKVLVVAPTGSGKTVIAARMIASAFEKGARSLFLAHRKELINQTVDKLERFGVKAGVIRGTEPMHLHRPVQVASVPTLVNRLRQWPELLKDFKLIFVDEAHHHTEDNQYGQIVEAFPEAIVIGLTASPWRLDGAGLGEVYGDWVLAETPARLRDLGYLVPLGGWEFVPIATGSAKVERGDFRAKDLEAEAMKARVVGNVVAEWKARAGGVRTVLFACTIAHSQMLAKAFVDAGVAAEHLDGETPDDERAGILRRIKSGATRVLCNVNVATEGWDCPELECVVLARPTLSTTLYLQQVGRVLRPCEGKVRALILDHAGLVRAHGHPYSERDFSPQKTANISRDVAEGRGTAAVTTRRCPKCRCLIDGWPCVGCGHQPEVKELPPAIAGKAVPLAEQPGWKAAMAKEEERKKRAEHYRNTSWPGRRAAFDAAVQRKGNVGQACGWYRWWSGDTEWPPREWQEEAREATA